MASLLSVGGLSTGIDTKTLLEQLINADRAPARLVEGRRSAAQAQLDAVKAMNTRLLTLRDTIDDMELGTTYAKRTATSSNESAVTISAGDGAQPGGTTLSVKWLASAQQLATGSIGSKDDALYTSGAITVQSAGATSSTTIAITDYSLTGIAKSINAAKAGVTASVINDGAGYRLLINSTKTGATNGIATLSADGDLAGLLPGAGVMTEAAPARDARLVIGDPVSGLPIDSASNTVEGVIPGATLTLKSPADGISIAVAQDAPEIRGAAQKLVDGFNAVRSYLKTSASYDTATKRAGPLFSDYEIRRQVDRIEDRLTATVATQPAGYRSLADIGISISSSGTMEIDSETFDAKVAADEDAVIALFRAAGSAAGSSLEGLTRSVDGSMALKQTRLEETIAEYTSRISVIDERLERRRALYQAQFLEMERLTAQFQSQGNALSGFVAGLNKSSAK
jgi:flagellar hook-associated protein 2